MILVCAQCESKNRVPAARLLAGPKCGRCKSKLAADAPIVVGSREEFDELAEAPVPVIVDFWAAWCGPCRMVAPELEKLARTKSGKVLIAKVDTEALPDVAARFAVRSIPLLVLLDHGREVRRASGAMPAASIAASLGI